MSSQSNLKIKGSILIFVNDFCKENDINIEIEKLKLPDNISMDSINEDEWYNFDILKNYLTEIENKKYTYLEKLGYNYFKYLKRTSDSEIFNTLYDIGNAVSSTYQMYHLFIDAKRIGMWSTINNSKTGSIQIKENGVMPAYFTKGFLSAMAEVTGCIAPRVRVVGEIGDFNNKESLNVYEISWMKKIKY